LVLPVTAPSTTTISKIIINLEAAHESNQVTRAGDVFWLVNEPLKVTRCPITY
jgi:hypothetical protein